ncbi:MAG: shikimate kinase [Clostridiaceae bacterium]
MKKNIVLIGMPGCGKSTIGNLLSEKLDIEVCDVDAYIVNKSGKTIPELFNISEVHFRDVEEECIKEISEDIGKIISAGGGVILRENNMKNLSKTGVIVFINRPLENILSDVDTESRPLLKDGADRLKKLYEDRIDLYTKYCDYNVKNDKPLNGVIDEIVEIIEEENVL